MGDLSSRKSHSAVRLKARPLLPILDAQWAATAKAAAELEAELAYPLNRLIDEALGALHHRPMRFDPSGRADRQSYDNAVTCW